MCSHLLYNSDVTTKLQSKTQAEDEINQTVFDTAKAQFDALEKRRHRGKSFSDILGNDVSENEISNKNDNKIENDNLIKNNNDIEL